MVSFLMYVLVKQDILEYIKIFPRVSYLNLYIPEEPCDVIDKIKLLNGYITYVWYILMSSTLIVQLDRKGI